LRRNSRAARARAAAITARPSPAQISPLDHAGVATLEFETVTASVFSTYAPELSLTQRETVNVPAVV